MAAEEAIATASSYIIRNFFVERSPFANVSVSIAYISCLFAPDSEQVGTSRIAVSDTRPSFQPCTVNFPGAVLGTRVLIQCSSK